MNISITTKHLPVIWKTLTIKPEDKDVEVIITYSEAEKSKIIESVSVDGIFIPYPAKHNDWRYRILGFVNADEFNNKEWDDFNQAIVDQLKQFDDPDLH